jgi:hypothetical protein
VLLLRGSYTAAKFLPCYHGRLGVKSWLRERRASTEVLKLGLFIEKGMPHKTASFDEAHNVELPRFLLCPSLEISAQSAASTPRRYSELSTGFITTAHRLGIL